MNAIETYELTCAFGDRVAVDRLTLAIPSGTIFGFLGPNGAGKTTTVRMLTTLIAPTRGTARVAGHDLTAQDDAIRRVVGILTETPGIYDKLSARQNLLFFARLYDVPEAHAVERIQRYLQVMELWERRDDPVGGFSKGMRQKLAIARALLHDPSIVFLDEPTAGLDPEAARTVRDVIQSLRTEGRTIFLTTHNLTEADELCDMIAVFRTRLLRVDSPESLRAAFYGRETRIRVDGDARAFCQAAQALPFVRSVTAEAETLIVALDDPRAGNPLLVAALVRAGARIQYVQPTAHSLEDVYLKLVQDR